MRRILIVDDEHVVADTLSLIFLKNGFETRVTYSASAALACAPEFVPELLLCDIDMPEMDGLALITAMRDQQPSCRILVLTGAYARLPHVLQRAESLKAEVSILIKPCQPANLLRRADDLLLTGAVA